MLKKLIAGAAVCVVVGGIVWLIIVLPDVDWVAVDAWFERPLTKASVGDVLIVGLVSAFLAGAMSS